MRHKFNPVAPLVHHYVSHCSTKTNTIAFSFALLRHVPREFYYSQKNPSKRVIEYTEFDYGTEQLNFSFTKNFGAAYQRALDYIIGQDTPFQAGQQKNCMCAHFYAGLAQ